jgi:ribosomal-protein-alanine acetyltransferase
MIAPMGAGAAMIAPMGAADAQAVADLDADLFGAQAWSPSAWQQEAAGAGTDRRYVVLREAGRLVGYAGIMRAGSDADVLTVAVARDCQRRGYGRLLVEELLDIARQWRTLALFLEVAQDNQAARALYVGLGFSEIGVRRHYYGPDRHGIVMRYQVREPMGALPLAGEEP